jgi:ferredoxin-type protein NapH
MFLSALLLGRLWCGWGCPAGAFQDFCFGINDRPARGRRFDWVKWGMWIPWIGLVAAMVVSAGGYGTVNLLHLTDSGISVDRPEGYSILYTVLGVFLILSITAGRRAGCHYICWMAPFTIIGRKMANLLRWPAPPQGG